MPRYLVQEVIYVDHFVIADDWESAFNFVDRSTTHEVLIPELIDEDYFSDEFYGDIVWEVSE